MSQKKNRKTPRYVTLLYQRLHNPKVRRKDRSHTPQHVHDSSIQPTRCAVLIVCSHKAMSRPCDPSAMPDIASFIHYQWRVALASLNTGLEEDQSEGEALPPCAFHRSRRQSDSIGPCPAGGDGLVTSRQSSITQASPAPPSRTSRCCVDLSSRSLSEKQS